MNPSDASDKLHGVSQGAATHMELELQPLTVAHYSTPTPTDKKNGLWLQRFKLGWGFYL